MSREVLGTTEDDQDDVTVSAPPRRSSAPVTDLDAPDPVDAPDPAGGPGATEHGTWSGLGTWSGRRRDVLLTAVVALTVGALVTAGLVEQAGRAADRSVVDVLAGMSGITAADDHVQLDYLVVNSGPEPVTVTEVTVAGDRELHLDGGPVTVSPGDSEEVTAGVPQACGQDGLADRTPGEVSLRVEAADGTTAQVAPTGLSAALGVRPDAFASFCGMLRGTVDTLPVWSTRVTRGGDLTIQVHNTRREPGLLTASSPPGTRLTADPPLPLELPAGRMTQLDLRLHVDRCTGAAQRADAGTGVDLLLDGEEGLVPVDEATLTGWFAQQVVRACG